MNNRVKIGLGILSGVFQITGFVVIGLNVNWLVAAGVFILLWGHRLQDINTD